MEIYAYDMCHESKVAKRELKSKTGDPEKQESNAMNNVAPARSEAREGYLKV